MVDKVSKVMHEWGQGELRSGSKQGPVVKDQKQAIAIALSEQRKANKGKMSRGNGKKKKHIFSNHPVSGESKW